MKRKIIYGDRNPDFLKHHLNVSIDPIVVAKGKTCALRQHMSLSRLVEMLLRREIRRLKL